MPDPDRKESPAVDLHLGNVAPFVAHRLGLAGALIITVDKDGLISLMAHGVNHALASMMLSRGTQMNLNQHDEFVRAGAASNEAQAQQLAVDAINAAAGGAK